MAKKVGTLTSSEASQSQVSPRNPFLEGWEQRIQFRSSTYAAFGAQEVTIKKPLDFSRVQLYEDFFDSDLSNLSKPALKLLFYVLSKLRWDQDYLELRHEKVQLAKSAFYRAVAELADYGLLAKRAGVRETYWVNPRKFFHGNRVSSFPNNFLTHSSPAPDVADA